MAKTAAIKPGTTFRDCPDCPEMMALPAGTFTMGSTRAEPGHYYYEEPQHLVGIESFAAGVYEVTFEDWDACIAGGGCLYRPDDQGWGRGKRPVINVSWDDAESYLDWLTRKTGKTYRLLTESEWEYAARGGTATAYWWGADIGRNNAACMGCGSAWDSKQTAPVGSFKPNAFGLYDTAGNVREWVEDCLHENYEDAPSDGSVWPGLDLCKRIWRGGSWDSFPNTLRSAARIEGGVDDRGIDVGFRVARDLP